MQDKHNKLKNGLQLEGSEDSETAAMSSADRIALVNFLKQTILFTFPDTNVKHLILMDFFFMFFFLVQAKSLPGSLSAKAIQLVETLEGKVSEVPFVFYLGQACGCIGYLSRT